MKRFSIINKLAIFIFLAVTGASSFAQSRNLIVTGINAFPSASTSEISVSWIMPASTVGYKINSVEIYRNTRPITDIKDLENARLLAKLPHGTVSYSDKVTTNQEYYYAVISLISENTSEAQEENLYYDEELDCVKDDEATKRVSLVLPGVNATVFGAKAEIKKRTARIIPEKKEEQKKTYENKMREQPLPYVDILGNSDSRQSTISDKAKTQVKDLLKEKRNSRELCVLDYHVFEEDMTEPSGGDDYLLFDILKTTFIKKKYGECSEKLVKFLGQNRSKDVTNRAIFYLGECYYYTGDFSKALGQFLLLEDVYPALSRKWSESTLDLYSYR